ncbi:hypothetical protein [Occallatibacter riparius]|uniref:Uncharacterized protein n=1 Tax=Occallatibacter riparius TaxID=1002689 RepID=A0A9J7BTS7_9BACT|nr:hypothetical protein [Occallatibacter riparius]UWZ86048.1 hypothetical protein MOP44_08895 [Occallatibacter riparius]
METISEKCGKIIADYCFNLLVLKIDREMRPGQMGTIPVDHSFGHASAGLLRGFEPQIIRAHEPALMAGFLLSAIIRCGSSPEREIYAHMSRTNRKHNRQIEQHRRNKGPELLCKAADNELQEKAGEMAAKLSEEMIKNGSVEAADLLLSLAERANYNENAAPMARISMAEKWSKEPPFEELDRAPQLMGPPVRGALTDGSEQPKAESDEIKEAEYEMVGPPAGSGAEAKP